VNGYLFFFSFAHPLQRAGVPFYYRPISVLRSPAGIAADSLNLTLLGPSDHPPSRSLLAASPVFVPEIKRRTDDFEALEEDTLNMLRLQNTNAR